MNINNLNIDYHIYTTEHTESNFYDYYINGEFVNNVIFINKINRIEIDEDLVKYTLTNILNDNLYYKKFNGYGSYLISEKDLCKYFRENKLKRILK